MTIVICPAFILGGLFEVMLGHLPYIFLHPHPSDPNPILRNGFENILFGLCLLVISFTSWLLHNGLVALGARFLPAWALPPPLLAKPTDDNNAPTAIPIDPNAEIPIATVTTSDT
jgi:hypothetical protein